MSYTHLTLNERYFIEHLTNHNVSYQTIAKRLNRSVSTISREVKKTAQHVKSITISKQTIMQN